MPTEDLFQTVAGGDPLRFGRGAAFSPEKVRGFLGLSNSDVSKLANVSVKSVRFDEAMPAAVRERFEEIANTCNMVAEIFGGDTDKTALWFKTRNPMLGDVSPRDMIRLRRFDRLRRFVVGAVIDRAVAHRQTVPAEPVS